MHARRLPFTNDKKGFRLHKLEVFNWGTFDGQVFTVRPQGNSSLLVGQNGSGKSTLVDALLTLLVRPGVRNFNVAAGAKKRERDERTYVRGAYDRGSDDENQGIHVKYLRPKGDHYSVILATFHNEDTGKSFTTAQLLYLASDQSVEKLYCLSEDERSIRDDFHGLESTNGVLKTLRERGFRATRTFQEFEGWFIKISRIKTKAMEVLNQTVAVKDIQRLNDFIRNHMLEPCDWHEKVDRLLGHFTQLSEAHDSLIRIRQQFELLEPIHKIGDEYRRYAQELDRADRLQAAFDAYISRRTVDLFSPALQLRQRELEQTRGNKDRIAKDLRSTQEHAHRLRGEIEHAGGDRLRQIPLLIEKELAQALGKQQAHARFFRALDRLDLPCKVNDEASFVAVQRDLHALQAKLESSLSDLNGDRDAFLLPRGECRREIQSLREELEGLNQRRENTPQWCVSLRQALCQQLGLAVRDLPFAAELIQVRPDARTWEASIEKVLRGFALSLLVPERFYHLVASHIDRTRLTAQGRGQRLVYLRVAAHDPAINSPSPGPRSLLSKLAYRDGHPLLPWVRAELLRRFDYDCCDTIEEFQQGRGLALTANRHIKSGGTRHEKDDREHALDPRNFVLGWDNREKKQRLAAEVEKRTRQETELDKRLDENEQRMAHLRDQLASIADVRSVASYAEIDFSIHEREVDNLERERRAIEENSDAIRLLKERLVETESEEKKLTTISNTLIGDERDLEREVTQAERLIANAQADLQRRAADGSLTEHRLSFAELDVEFADSPLSAEDLFEREKNFRGQLQTRISGLRNTVTPIQNRLLEAMAKFLRFCPEEIVDLRASVDYLDSFLQLRKHIAEDDLPRHEERFKERLNRKVIEEIGLFRNALERERRNIEGKIELLNVSLRKLEYRPGTHIQLEPRPIRDAEIVAFQGKLRECVEGSFEDSAEANESRFLRIKELVIRLRDEENRRWRDKVTDVRRWFDFVATVIDRGTLKTVSVYQDSSGQSGGEKAKLAFTILVAAIAYQYDLDPEHPVSDRFHFVVIDEMFSKVDDQHAQYALELFKQFGLQLLIVAPLDAKARITQPYVGTYLHVVKKENRSAIFEMSAREFEACAVGNNDIDSSITVNELS